MSRKSLSRSIDLLVICLVITITFVVSSCSDNEKTGPEVTGPEALVDVSGSVIAGTEDAAAPEPLAGGGMSGVAVRHSQSGVTATTNGSGEFVLNRVPSGAGELTFDRGNMHARANVVIPRANGSPLTVSIVGNKAVVVYRGHAGAEIEGVVQSVNLGASTLVVVDDRLGAVTVRTDASTIFRFGGTALTLADIVAGDRVHVKAVQESDTMYLATEVKRQGPSGGPPGKPTATPIVTPTNTPGGGLASVNVSGSVIAGTDASAPQTLAVTGMSGVAVRHTQSGATATTNGSGEFVLRVPPGAGELTFDRGSLHARANVAIPRSNTALTVAIVGNKAVVVYHGHAGAEIEGIVQSVDLGASTLVVVDQRLGTVTVLTDASTIFRHGGSALTLADIAPGDRVHVKALQQDGGTYLATEVKRQSTGGGVPGTPTTTPVVTPTTTPVVSPTSTPTNTPVVSPTSTETPTATSTPGG